MESSTNNFYQPLEMNLDCIITEKNLESSIWCVRFCDSVIKYQSYFASVGSNSATIYKINDDDITLFSTSNSAVEHIQKYIDEDLNEDFYSCTWCSTKIYEPLLVVGGKQGIIKVINCTNYHLEYALCGHGNSINDLQCHKTESHLLLSASKDRSIRLWNVHTFVCVAIFCGDGGHTNEVLSIDTHLLGNCFASSSSDTSIKIWNLKDPQLQAAIHKSNIIESNLVNDFQTCIQQNPLFSTTQIHRGYVDCIKWMGDHILSKSTNSRMVLWSPDSMRYKDAVIILQEYELSDSDDIWFIKFDVSIPWDIFAVGNKSGKVQLFPLSSFIPKNKKNVSHNNDSLNTNSSSYNDANENNPGQENNKEFTKERFLTPKCKSVGSLYYPRCDAMVRYSSFSSDGKYIDSSTMIYKHCITWTVDGFVKDFHRIERIQIERIQLVYENGECNACMHGSS
eukprot:gene5376-7454_t